MNLFADVKSSKALWMIVLASAVIVHLSYIDNGFTWLEHGDIEMGHARALLAAKNHDYGEAWRDMRISSMTDLILMKLLRIKQIEDNAGKTVVSEGLEANYQDIINYAIFALIKAQEKKQNV